MCCVTMWLPMALIGMTISQQRSLQWTTHCMNLLPTKRVAIPGDQSLHVPKGPSQGKLQPNGRTVDPSTQNHWVTCAPLADRNHAHRFFTVVTTHKPVYSHGLHFAGCPGLCSPCLHMIPKHNQRRTIAETSPVQNTKTFGEHNMLVS